MSDSINPNVSTGDVPASTTIEVAGGDSAVSFDDLESIDRAQAQAAKTEKKDKTHTASPKQDTAPVKRAAKKGDGDISGDAEDDGDVSSDVDDITKDATAKQEKPRLTKIKAADGKEVEVDLTSNIQVTVDGKPVEVSLEELRNNYSGKVAWSERFSKFENEKKSFTQEKTHFQSRISEVAEAARTDGMSAMMKMAEMSGQDPLVWREQFLDNVLPTLANYLEMTDDERRVAELEHQNKYLKTREESQRTKTQEEHEFHSFQTKVETLQQTHQIDPETFKSTYFDLEKLQKLGQLKGEITPEMVTEVVKTERLYDQVTQTLSEMKITDESEVDRAFKHMNDVAKAHPDLSADDLKEICIEVFGKRKAQVLSRKVQGSSSGSQPRRNAGPKNPGSEPVSFDDL